MRNPNRVLQLSRRRALASAGQCAAFPLVHQSTEFVICLAKHWPSQPGLAAAVLQANLRMRGITEH